MSNETKGPQPPAEAQPVAWEWEYIGGDHYPRGHKVARSLREMDPTNPPYPETWRPTRPLIYGDTAPPSAPVGVEAKDAEIEALRVRADAMAGEAIKHEARAERLAEALRDIESRPWNGVRPIQIAARAALRDHDQEVSNG